jgi:hypothetical protein
MGQIPIAFMAVPGGTHLSLRIPSLSRFRRICYRSKPLLLRSYGGILFGRHLEHLQASCYPLFAQWPLPYIAHNHSRLVVGHVVLSCNAILGSRLDAWTKKVGHQPSQSLVSSTKSAREAARPAAQSFGDHELNGQLKESIDFPYRHHQSLWESLPTLRTVPGDRSPY